jgi:hypothetical protein
MSVNVTTAVWQADIRPAARKFVLLRYADHARNDGTEARPGFTSVALACALSYSTVQRHVASLERDGLLVLERKATQHLPAVYRVNVRLGTVPTLDSIQAGQLRAPGWAITQRQAGQLRAPGWAACPVIRPEPPAEEPPENPPAVEAPASGGPSGSAKPVPEPVAQACAILGVPPTGKTTRAFLRAYEARRAAGATDADLILVVQWARQRTRDGDDFRNLTRLAWLWGGKYAESLASARAWRKNPNGKKEFRVMEPGPHRDEWDRSYEKKLRERGLA